MSDQKPTRTVADARVVVADLFRHDVAIYWADFLTTLTVGYGAASVYLSRPIRSPLALACLVVAVCALYRLGSFMHEIAHFRSREMRSFRIAWDILAGIPMLTPSFFYESHNDHHNAHHYGTKHDGEYLPLASGSLRTIMIFLFQVFVQPIVVTVRFLLAPLTFLHPKVRRWTLEHASSFVIDFRYQRSIAKNAPLRSWALMDLACSIRAAAIFGFIFAGVTDWTRVPQLYLLATAVLALNYVRTLAAHRYINDGRRMTHEEQLLDSTNITGGRIWTELLCPLGMRYHALHHLFPRLPYHNLGIAHRRLMAELPADSPYRATVYPSWRSVVRELVQNATSSGIPAHGELRRETSVAELAESFDSTPARTKVSAPSATTGTLESFGLSTTARD